MVGVLAIPCDLLADRKLVSGRHRVILDGVGVAERLNGGGLRWRGLDSNLYGAFPCQVVFIGLLPVLCSEREGPFFIPSPTIRFPERAQRGQGTETLAKLGALPPSGACVWQRLDA